MAFLLSQTPILQAGEASYFTLSFQSDLRSLEVRRKVSTNDEGESFLKIREGWPLTSSGQRGSGKDAISDKEVHFLLGTGISLAVAGAACLFHPDYRIEERNFGALAGLAFSTGVAAGIIKELADLCGQGTEEIADVVATAAGGLMAGVIAESLGSFSRNGGISSDLVGAAITLCGLLLGRKTLRDWYQAQGIVLIKGAR